MSALPKLGTGLLGLLISLALAPTLVAAQAESTDYPVRVTLIQNPSTDLTYARDVAPILQENCLKCHREGSVAPMALETYEDVRRYASRISHRVVRRQMPPWPIDRNVAVSYTHLTLPTSDLV